MDVQGSRVTITAVGNQALCLCNSIVKIYCMIHRQYRRKFLMSKFLGNIHGFDFTD